MLRADGHDVTAHHAARPGVEDDRPLRDHLRGPRRRDHRARSRPPTGPPVLVVHSASGFSGYAASDQVPERIAAMVYVDTAPGKPPLDAGSQDRRQADGLGRDRRGGEPRRPDRGAAGHVPRAGRAGPGRRPARRVRVHERRPPGHPVDDHRDRLHRRGLPEVREGAPRVPSFLAGIPELRNVTWIDLPTSHWPMWSKPADIARIIGEVATTAGAGPRDAGAPGDDAARRRHGPSHLGHRAC